MKMLWFVVGWPSDSSLDPEYLGGPFKEKDDANFAAWRKVSDGYAGIVGLMSAVLENA